MSVSTVINIKDRILAATERSKIAVFRSHRGGTVDLNAVFDNTVATRKRIKWDSQYIGSYYGNNGRLAFANDLRGN